MSFSPALLIPLGCALAYVFGAMAVKHAASRGVDVLRTSFTSNWMMALIFLPLFFRNGGSAHPLTDYWQPALSGVLFLAGQALTFLALDGGDVTVITPVMGAKVIMVALATGLLHAGRVPLVWWIGAGFSTTAVLLLHLGPSQPRRAPGRTLTLALASAACFSVGDVLIQKWLPQWGLVKFLPPLFLVAAVLSFFFIPFFRDAGRRHDGLAWRWLLLGASLLAVNNAGFVLGIALVGSATVTNIIYSARGLFSVIAVWLVGHWFRNDEGRLGRTVLGLRLAGGGLMLAAIALVLR